MNVWQPNYIIRGHQILIHQPIIKSFLYSSYAGLGYLILLFTLLLFAWLMVSKADNKRSISSLTRRYYISRNNIPYIFSTFYFFFLNASIKVYADVLRLQKLSFLAPWREDKNANSWFDNIKEWKWMVFLGLL